MAAKSLWRTRAMGAALPWLMARKASRAVSSSQLPCWQSTRIQSNPACDINSTPRCDPKTAPAPIAALPANRRCLAAFVRMLALSPRRATGIHRQVATVHGDQRAGDPAGSVGSQEDGQALDVVRLTKAANRDATQ